MASGGTDARVIVWADSTAADAAAEAEEEELLMDQEQELANALAVNRVGLLWLNGVLAYNAIMHMSRRNHALAQVCAK